MRHRFLLILMLPLLVSAGPTLTPTEGVSVSNGKSILTMEPAIVSKEFEGQKVSPGGSILIFRYKLTDLQGQPISLVAAPVRLQFTDGNGTDLHLPVAATYSNSLQAYYFMTFGPQELFDRGIWLAPRHADEPAFPRIELRVTPEKASAQAGAPQVVPEDLSAEFRKRTAATKAVLAYDEAKGTWTLVLQAEADALEYSRSMDGVGEPTGSLLYSSPGGGLDPLAPRPLEEDNVIIVVCRRGAKYGRQDKSKPGTVSTLARISSFEDLIPFIGIGSEIRFASDRWVKMGTKRYKNGGFSVSKDKVELLRGTEIGE